MTGFSVASSPIASARDAAFVIVDSASRFTRPFEAVSHAFHFDVADPYFDATLLRFRSTMNGVLFRSKAFINAGSPERISKARSSV